jgi:hypothetical protein
MDSEKVDDDCNWESIFMEVRWHYRFNALTSDDIQEIKKAKNPRHKMYELCVKNYREERKRKQQDT